MSFEGALSFREASSFLYPSVASVSWLESGGSGCACRGAWQLVGVGAENGWNEREGGSVAAGCAGRCRGWCLGDARDANGMKAGRRGWCLVDADGMKAGRCERRLRDARGIDGEGIQVHGRMASRMEGSDGEA